MWPTYRTSSWPNTRARSPSRFESLWLLKITSLSAVASRPSFTSGAAVSWIVTVVMNLTAFLLSRCWATRREQWRSWSRFCCSGTQWRWWALEGTPLPCSGSSPTEKRSGDSSESSRLSSSTRIKIFVLMKGHSLEITPPRHYRCSLYIHF